MFQQKTKMSDKTVNVLAGVGVVTVIVLTGTFGYLFLKKKSEEDIVYSKYR